MKRKIIVLAAFFFALAATAQEDVPASSNTANIDWSEDSTEIVTIQDIINVQQRQTKRNATESHFGNVWGRRGYFNFAYNGGKLSPKGNYATGVPDLHSGKVGEMSSDWGFNLQYGRNYHLHKTPISNLVSFYIDYTGIDLTVNHFKAERALRLYNSKAMKKSADGKDSCFYMPWNLEKYEISYGMTIGPSVTVAPFNLMSNQNLHFLKLNLYYHIGYHVSMIYMPDDENADINEVKNGGTTSTERKNYETMAENLKMAWGHGLTHSFGFNVSWKAIGIGYEHRSRTVKYKVANTTDFGSEKYEFKVPDNRVYLQIRM
jgi:hypothetical protein